MYMVRLLYSKVGSDIVKVGVVDEFVVSLT